MIARATTVGAALAVLAPHLAAVPADDELRDEVAALVDEAASDLAALGFALDRERIAVRVKTLEASRDDFEATFALMLPPGHFEAWVTLLSAFGVFAGERVDADELREAAVASMGAVVQAHYLVGQDAFVVLDTDTGRFGRALVGLGPVVRHELVHAWQDQRGCFGTLLAPARTSVEKARIASCLVEGQAELATLACLLGVEALAELDADDLESQLESVLAGDYAEIYRAGRAYALARFHAGGFEAVQAALDDPPTSSEQILHPEKEGLDLPTPVRLPELGAPVLFEDTLGELQTAFLLSALGTSPSEARLAATGWDGDRYAVLETHDGERVVVWRSLWDRVEDAGQVAAILAATPGTVRVSGRLVDWVGGGNRGVPPFPREPAPPGDDTLVDFEGLPEALDRDAVTAQVLERLDASRPDPGEAPESDAATTAAAEQAVRARLAARTPVSDGERWAHASAGLSLVIPEGFEVRETRGMSILAFADDPDASGFTTNVTVQVLPAPPGLDLDGFLEANAAQLAAIDGLDLVVQRKVRVSGREAAFYEMTSTDFPMAGQSLHFMGLAYLRAGRQVIVTATVTESRWDEFAETFAELLLHAEVDALP